MMKRNRLTAGLLAIAMLGASIPAYLPSLTVCAAEETPTEGTCGESMTWKLDTKTGKLTITGTGYMTSHPWEPLYDQIKTVEIANGVLSID